MTDESEPTTIAKSLSADEQPADEQSNEDKMVELLERIANK